MSDEENNIKKLLRALVTPVQDLEDTLQTLLVERSIDTAVGEQLNVLGRLVGQERAGLVDDDYRRVLRARISVHRSKGTIADINKITRLIAYPDPLDIEIDNHGPAALTVYVNGGIVSFQTSATLAKLLQEAVAGGVRIFLETQNISDADAFTFDNFAETGLGPGKGFETFDETDGGKLGNVI
jgi:hypothetical protein